MRIVFAALESLIAWLIYLAVAVWVVKEENPMRWVDFTLLYGAFHAIAILNKMMNIGGRYGE